MPSKSVVGLIEILDLLKDMRIRMQSSSDFEKIISDKEKELSTIKIKLQNSSKKLTSNRLNVVPEFKKNIEYCPIASELLVTNSQSLKASP